MDPIAPPAQSEDRQQQYAKCLKDLQVKAEAGDREAFLKTFKEVRFYAYNDDYSSKLYDQLPEMRTDDAAFKAHINRVSEYVEIFGSHLYPQNPEASVNPQDNVDDWTLKRFNLEAKCLDYFMRQGALETHARRALNEGLMSGRGVAWFGYNARKGIPQVVFDTVENLLLESDAKSFEELNWIGRKRRKPRFEFKKLIDQPLIDLDEDLKGVGANGEIIEYVEFYLRVGISNFCRGNRYVSGEETDSVTPDGQAVVDDSPKKYILAEGRLVSIDDWEIPFFEMDAWPCRLLDFRLQPEKLWPVSPIQPGLGHLRAMNWLYTFYVNRVRSTSRLTYARLTHKAQRIEQKAVDTITGSDGTPEGQVINFELPIADADADIRKYIQPISLEHGIAEFDRMWALVNRAFEDATGLNDLMRAGQDSRQIRTAKDVAFKEERSMTRVEDMKKQVQLWLDGIQSQLAFTGRFLLTAEDVGKWFGPDAAQLWGRLGTPEEKAQEDMQRMQMKNMMMKQALMQAQQAQMQGAQMGMPTPPPPMPDDAQMELQLGPPQIMVMEDWINEAKREIVAGSMRVMDHDAQVDNLNMFFSALAPIIAPTPGGPEFIASAINEWVEKNRYTPAMQAAGAKYLTTVTTAMALMAQQQQMMASQPPPEKPGEEPPQGAAQASKGQAQ